MLQNVMIIYHNLEYNSTHTNALTNYLIIIVFLNPHLTNKWYNYNNIAKIIKIFNYRSFL